MGRFYNRLLLVQTIILVMMFAVPKLLLAENESKSKQQIEHLPSVQKELNGIIKNSQPATPLSQAMKPYSIKYNVIAKGDKVGTASRTLTKLTNGQWQIDMKSKVRYFFYGDKRQEISRFDLIEENIYPKNYQRLVDSSFKDSSIIQQFDWDAGVEQGTYKKKSWSIELPDGALDQLTQLLSVRLQILKQRPLKQVVISYRGQIRVQNFKVVGEETLQTKMGTLKTVKILLDETKRKRKTFFWLASEHNMLPVKIQRIKKGKEEAQLIATSW